MGIERRKKMHMSHFAIWFVSANQPESMSFHNELSSTILSILLPCGCLLSHPLNVEYILSYSKGFSLSLSLSPLTDYRQLIFIRPSLCLFLSLPLSTPKKPVTYSSPPPHPPHPHPPCAGLEIEMMEAMGGFDWLRCWDVILSKLKCEVCACCVYVRVCV